MPKCKIPQISETKGTREICSFLKKSDLLRLIWASLLKTICLCFLSLKGLFYWKNGFGADLSTWSYNKPMPAIFLRQELFHQMFAMSDIVMFSQKYLTAVHQEKWFLGFLHKNSVKNRYEISLFILLKCWMALPGNRLFLHQELHWERGLHWRTSSWSRGGEGDKWSILKLLQRSDGGIPVAVLGHFPENPTIFSSFIFPPHPSSLEDRPGTWSWWKEVENSHFALVFVLRNDFFFLRKQI